MAERTFLVIGAPRSGTTLLVSSLAMHSRMVVLNEVTGNVIRDVVGMPVVGNKLCTPRQIELTERTSLAIRMLRPMGLMRRHSVNKLSIIDYIEQFDSRIIGIVRDPHSAIMSMIERGGQRPDLAVYAWSRSVQILHALKTHHADRFLLLTFEGALSSFQNAMERCADFLGEPYEEAMLAGHSINPYYQGYGGIDQNRIDARLKDESDTHRYAIDPDVERLYKDLIAATDTPS